MKTIVWNLVRFGCVLAVVQVAAGEGSGFSPAQNQRRTRRVVEQSVPVRIPSPQTEEEESSAPSTRTTPQIERQRSLIRSTESSGRGVTRRVTVTPTIPMIPGTIQRGDSGGTPGQPSLPSQAGELGGQTRTGRLIPVPEGGKTAPSSVVVPGAAGMDHTPSRVQLKEAFGAPIVPELQPANVETPPGMALGQQLADEQAMAGPGAREMTGEERTKVAMGLQSVLDAMNSLAGRGALLGRLQEGSSAVEALGTRLQGDSDDVLSMPEQDLPGLPSLTGEESGESGGDEGMSLQVGRMPGMGGQGEGRGSGSSGLTTGAEHSHIAAGKSRSAIASCGGSSSVSTHIGNNADGSGHTTTTYRNRSGSTTVQVLRDTSGKTTRVIVTQKDNEGNTTSQVSFMENEDGKLEVEPELAPVTDGDGGEDNTGGQETVSRPDDEQHYRTMTLSLEEAIAQLQGSVVDSNVIMPNPDDDGGGGEEGGGVSGLPDQRGAIEQPVDEFGGREDLIGPSSRSAEALARDQPQGVPEPIDPLGPGEGR